MGPPPARPQSRTDQGPAHIRSAFTELIAERGWVIPELHPLLARWPALVGEEIARHVTAVDFQAGELVVRADSKAWAAQIPLLADLLVPRLNQESRREPVRAIRVLSPADGPLPAERGITAFPAPTVNAASAPVTTHPRLEAQPADGQPTRPFYAPPAPRDTLSAAERIRALALRRARASQPS
ncbi:DciA family protein [Streptomyces sp. NPDC127106]|uniref:DciA family protein n=1 Tax=Streptomyces sp. NPDC127106 TaxID=3345360 RepID=UPI0036322D71